jgi:hypothetical protein
MAQMSKFHPTNIEQIRQEINLTKANYRFLMNMERNSAGKETLAYTSLIQQCGKCYIEPNA